MFLSRHRVLTVCAMLLYSANWYIRFAAVLILRPVYWYFAAVAFLVRRITIWWGNKMTKQLKLSALFVALVASGTAMASEAHTKHGYVVSSLFRQRDPRSCRMWRPRSSSRSPTSSRIRWRNCFPVCENPVRLRQRQPASWSSRKPGLFGSTPEQRKRTNRTCWRSHWLHGFWRIQPSSVWASC